MFDREYLVGIRLHIWKKQVQRIIRRKHQKEPIGSYWNIRRSPEMCFHKISSSVRRPEKSCPSWGPIFWLLVQQAEKSGELGQLPLTNQHLRWPVASLYIIVIHPLTQTRKKTAGKVGLLFSRLAMTILPRLVCFGAQGLQALCSLAILRAAGASWP